MQAHGFAFPFILLVHFEHLLHACPCPSARDKDVTYLHRDSVRKVSLSSCDKIYEMINLWRRNCYVVCRMREFQFIVSALPCFAPRSIERHCGS